MLAELSTKNIFEVSNPETLDEHAQVAVRGGEIARNACRKPELKPGSFSVERKIGNGDR